ncbi:MAG: hypothetical protein GXY82_02650 [Methanospirillum sp.]|nr:hypothetical protein [Methanospirillum sp.]
MAPLAPSQLDARHWGVRVGWSAGNDTGERAGIIGFEVIYFVQMTGAGPKISESITGDEEGELRRLGPIGRPDQGEPSGG